MLHPSNDFEKKRNRNSVSTPLKYKLVRSNNTHWKHADWVSKDTGFIGRQVLTHLQASQVPLAADFFVVVVGLFLDGHVGQVHVQIGQFCPVCTIPVRWRKEASKPQTRKRVDASL